MWVIGLMDQWSFEVQHLSINPAIHLSIDSFFPM
jgi:hypothetical protein